MPGMSNYYNKTVNIDVQQTQKSDLIKQPLEWSMYVLY